MTMGRPRRGEEAEGGDARGEADAAKKEDAAAAGCLPGVEARGRDQSRGRRGRPGLGLRVRRGDERRHRAGRV